MPNNAQVPYTRLHYSNTSGKQRLFVNSYSSSVTELGQENGVTWSALKMCHHSVKVMLQFKLNCVHNQNRKTHEGNCTKIYHNCKTVGDWERLWKGNWWPIKINLGLHSWRSCCLSCKLLHWLSLVGATWQISRNGYGDWYEDRWYHYWYAYRLGGFIMGGSDNTVTKIRVQKNCCYKKTDCRKWRQ